MPLSKSLTQPFRRNELFVGAGWRAMFAPFNAAASYASSNTTVGPSILDLETTGPFNSNAPPAGWTDLGWIKDLKITPGSKIGQVKSGYRGATRAQYRGEVAEQFEFSFREMTRMAFKIATGTTPFNLLSNTVPASTTGPLNASGGQAVAMGASGYQSGGAGATLGSPTVFVPAGSGSLFAANQYIVVDQDYNGTSYGIVGDAGVNIFNAAVTDVNYLRKTSDYVARIVSISAGAVAGQDGLVIDQPFIGGGNAATGTPNNAPTAGAKVQIIKGFAAREGGTTITEWSALLINDTIDGAQLAVYYPHASIMVFKDFAAWAIANIGTTDLTGSELQCTMEALAFDDPLDGETVVSYKAFYPGGRNQNLSY